MIDVRGGMIQRRCRRLARVARSLGPLTRSGIRPQPARGTRDGRRRDPRPARPPRPDRKGPELVAKHVLDFLSLDRGRRDAIADVLTLDARDYCDRSSHEPAAGRCAWSLAGSSWRHDRSHLTHQALRRDGRGRRSQLRRPPGGRDRFLGPNGAGKSTTMRMILGLDNPTPGSCDRQRASLAEHAAPLTELGALLEARAIHPQRSARNHLRALAATTGIPDRRVDDVLGLSASTRWQTGPPALSRWAWASVSGSHPHSWAIPRRSCSTSP